MPKQPESKLVSKIKDLVKSKGGRPFKIQGSDEEFQEVGIPDLLCCIYGWFVGIEVKLPGEKLRPRQRLVLREICEAGGVAAIVETVGQAALLLSYLEDRRADEVDRGVAFVRGNIHRRHDFRFE